MSFKIQLEKIVFIIQEMELALYLSQNAPDEFTRRMLARHILVRADNFIEHIRRLKRPLNMAGFNTTQFNLRKETYAKYFEEYFQTSRDKLSGHVQDLDFGKRIELWNDIESVKLGFFVDGAREIYENILAMGITGFGHYIQSDEIFDVELKTILDELCDAKSSQQWVEMASDPLAMTRPNTITFLNSSIIHARAGQLVLIRRWLKSQLILLEVLKKFAGTQHILKARIVTDLVSFCDGLVSRQVPSGASQEMEGLNTILSGLGEDTKVIDDFIATYRFSEKLHKFRYLRDKIGAHLAVDNEFLLPDLLQKLDELQPSDISDYFERLTAIFFKVCRSVNYLGMYVVEDQPLYGIGVGQEQAAVVPFDEKNPAPQTKATLEYQDWNDVNAYNNNLKNWLQGDPIIKGAAQNFFWNVFLYSEVIERVEEVEDLGSGSYRRSFHEFRKGHQYILNLLSSHVHKNVLAHVLNLLLECGRGAPYEIAEILVRNGESRFRSLSGADLCYYLGEIAYGPHSRVRKFLRKRLDPSFSWKTQFHATLAIFKILIRSDGIRRINDKISNETYSELIQPIISNLRDDLKLYHTIAFASQFCSRTLAGFLDVFKNDYRCFQTEIRELSVKQLGTFATTSVLETLDALIQSHDYAGVCLLLSDKLKEARKERLAVDLLEAVFNGIVVTANHEQSQRHLACCLLRGKHYQQALDIAEHLASHNPDNVTKQLFVAQILANIPGKVERGRELMRKLKMDYQLSGETEEVFSSLDDYFQSA